MKTISNHLKTILNLTIIVITFSMLRKVYHLIIFKNLTDKYIFNLELPQETSLENYSFLVIIYLVLFSYLIQKLFTFRGIINDFSKENIFIKIHGQQLKKVSSGLLVFAFSLVIIKLGLVIYLHDWEVPDRTGFINYNPYAYGFGFIIGKTLAHSFSAALLIILSLFIQMISELSEQGVLIKNENDLTI